MSFQTLATGYGLSEGPVWAPGRGLYFSDVTNGGVFLISTSGGVSAVVPHRKGIGGMAVHADGGLVVGGKNIAFKGLGDERNTVLLDSAAIPGAVGFNDLTTDAKGRIYVGSISFQVLSGEGPKPGQLHVIDLDGTARAISDGVMLTCGPGLPPAGSRRSRSDTRPDVVRLYDVKPDGSVSAWRPFATVAQVPHGRAVASDGSVRVAPATGGAVGVFNPP